MPFTLSHPAAALVLRRSGLPVAGVVAGTIAPDLPLFLHSAAGYRLAHSVVGIGTVDLAIGMAGLAAWRFVLRDALVDTAPAPVRERIAAHAGYSRRQWALAAPAVVAGALTHVSWDELTHEGRWGARHVAWLREPHLGWAGYHWAQAASSVAGLLVVAGWAGSTLGRSPRRPRPVRVPALAGRVPAVAVVAATAGGVGAMAAASGQGLHAMALAAVIRGLPTAALVLAGSALVWRRLARRPA